MRCAHIGTAHVESVTSDSDARAPNGSAGPSDSALFTLCTICSRPCSGDEHETHKVMNIVRRLRSRLQSQRVGRAIVFVPRRGHTGCQVGRTCSRCWVMSSKVDTSFRRASTRATFWSSVSSSTSCSARIRFSGQILGHAHSVSGPAIRDATALRILGTQVRLAVRPSPCRCHTAGFRARMCADRQRGAHHTGHPQLRARRSELLYWLRLQGCLQNCQRRRLLEPVHAAELHRQQSGASAVITRLQAWPSAEIWWVTRKCPPSQRSQKPGQRATASHLKARPIAGCWTMQRRHRAAIRNHCRPPRWRCARGR